MSPFEILRILIFGFPVPPEMIDPHYPELLQSMGGLQLTLVITFLSFLFGTPLGLSLAILRTSRGKRSKILKRKYGFYLGTRWIAVMITEGVRAVPVLILVLLAFYLPYRIFGVRIPPVILAVGVFTIYGGVYLSEVFRSGIRAVDEGYIHAAMTLGLSKRQILMKIKFPIIIRTMIPTFLNLAITVFKDTSVLVVVAVPELTYSGRSLQVASPANYSLVLFLIILIYWSIASAGAAFVKFVELRWRKIIEMP
jgi:His/Glu/Gln/Arg/opine family amino acid ABC transporter permease subunit